MTFARAFIGGFDIHIAVQQWALATAWSDTEQEAELARYVVMHFFWNTKAALM